MNRRELLKTTAIAAAASVAAPMINKGRYQLFAASAKEYSSRAVDLMGRATVVDMLSPFTLNFPKMAKHMANPELWAKEEWPEFKSSGIHAFHIGVGVGGPDAYVSTLQFFAAWNGFIAHNDRYLMRIDSTESLDRVKTSGKVGVIIGLQNSEHFRTAKDVEFFHGIGQRVSQLTYNTRNMIGNGSTERTDDGLSDYGVSIVDAMNKIGMAVDTSHCGERTTIDACSVSKKPVLITHSNCRAITNHPRCKSDDAIKAMGKSGGVMGITGVRMFVLDHEPTTVEHVLDQFDHVAKLVGAEHLGVGSDIDLHGYDAL
ncbi:MAG: membrane dipeptidase, partial [Acidobacteria bacterium]|nr:membrane dipeptidase [Acidobacteriota bacterium]